MELLISPSPDQEGNKLMFLSEWREFPFSALPCRGKKNLMTARVSMLLKSRASLTCFRTCFLPGRAKDLSAPPVIARRSETSRCLDIETLLRPERARCHYCSGMSQPYQIQIRFCPTGDVRYPVVLSFC